MKLIDLRNCSRHDGPYFFAVEEYFLKKTDEKEDLFFTWTLDPCVVVGRHQLINREVNRTYMDEHQFPIWRRPSGGGTVFADRGCIMFSFITSHQNNHFVFDHYLNRVVDAFKVLGLIVTFTGRNDLLVDGYKISGSSFYRYKDRVVLHGTILYDVDIDHLVRAITPSDEKLISKGIESVRQRVMNIHDRLSLSKDQLIDYLSTTMCNDVTHLSLEEESLIHQMAEKYATREWIYDKNPPYSKEIKGTFPSGNITIRLEIKANKIESFNMSGDYFTLLPIEELISIYLGQPYTLESMMEINRYKPIENYLYRMTSQEWLNLLTK
jgi:lipoyltransferase/lipoate-protein ligase